MPVSGLILTLSDDRAKRDSALVALRENPAIELGELMDHRLPVAVETPSSDADQQLWHWLHSLPGVIFVDLVCADSSTDHSAGAERSAGGNRT